MKTIIDELPMFKISIKPDGKADIALATGKQFTGQMTPAEMEQILFRVSQISEKVVSFDPEPTDLINVHEQDLITLQKQAEMLEELREKLSGKDAEIEKYKDIAIGASTDKETAEKALDECRRELSKVRIELSDANVKIQELTPKEPEIVHNVQNETPKEEVSPA